MKLLQKSLILIIAFIASTSMIYAQKDFLYKTNEGKFSVKFPGEYQETIEDGETAKTVKIQCNIDDHTYLASYSLHKIEMTDHEEMAGISLESFNDAVGGNILSKEEWKVKKHFGLKANIDLPENESKLEYRVILIGNTQIQLIALAAYDNYDEAVVKAFYKSFKLKK